MLFRSNEMDDICAIVGIHSVGLRADSDFFGDPDAMRELSIHKSAPLTDPRQPPDKAPAGAGRNGAKRRNGQHLAKTGP